MIEALIYVAIGGCLCIAYPAPFLFLNEKAKEIWKNITG